MVPQLLPSVAGHYFLRYIRLPAASSELTGLPKALPLGELARSAREGKDAAKQLLHCDRIALTKSLLTAVQQL